MRGCLARPSIRTASIQIDLSERIVLQRLQGGVEPAAYAADEEKRMPIPREPASGNRVILKIFALLLAVGIFFVTSCAKKQEPVKRPPVPVTVSMAIQKTVPVQLTAIGNVDAYSTIQVKSQIGGLLMKVHFREGQDVSKGQLLFTIDPRPYEAQIKQAESNLAKDIAQMEYAREQSGRYAELVKKGYVAKDQYEQFLTNAATAEAVVNADRAVLENAKLQLKYCYIYSPISGRTGNLLSNEGNLIKADADTAMVTIQQVEPIYVTFSVPEQDLAEIKKNMAAGQLRIEALTSTKGGKPAGGVLTFIDNAVDITTGTIKMKGTFLNRDRSLWPGQFVNVALTLGTKPDAVLVPTSAVQTGQNGQYVFVVRADSTVEMRPIAAGMTIGGETVIDKGVAPGETVVTDGHLMLSPGARVEVRKPARSVNGAASVGAEPALPFSTDKPI
jgi:multidrug efflux system membrane fusion protein